MAAGVKDRILRRELTGSRSVWVACCTLLTGLAAGYVALELALSALNAPPLWRSLDKWWLLLSDPLLSLERPAVLVTGLVCAVLGVVFIIAALSVTRRPRLNIELDDEQGMLIVDYQVVAADLARVARTAAGVGQGQVWVSVGADQALVQVRPTSGIPVDAERVGQALRDELQRNDLAEQLEVKVEISTNGVVGQ